MNKNISIGAAIWYYLINVLTWGTLFTIKVVIKKAMFEYNSETALSITSIQDHQTS